MATVSVGSRLRSLREERALSLRRLAALAAVDSGLLSKLENDLRPLTGACAWRLARILGVEVLALTDAGELTRSLHLASAGRRPDLDEGNGRRVFVLSGDVRVSLPAGLAQRLGEGRQAAAGAVSA